jgi:hypothetical protein
MIPDDLRLALVDELLRVPFVDGDNGLAGRDALLTGIPNRFLHRNEGNARGDMLLLVDQLAGIFGPNGEWRLLQFVNNALPSVEGSEPGLRLHQIRKDLAHLERGFRSVHVHPAEVAQVHLFDLRQPVSICIGSLPAVAGASGFVIRTPTPRLLAYFCDSLKQRGQESRVWRRDEVAATMTPLVIDPKHTTVALAAGKSDRVRSLLARKHVLWPVYVDDAADAAALWRQLDETFGATLAHHLVVAFGMPSGTEVPAGMTLLPAPRFTSVDISNWVSDIGRTLPWHQAEIEWWAGVIVTGCSGNPDDLPIEAVYQQLEDHCRLIAQNRDPDDLMNALRELESWSLPKGRPWATPILP